MKVDFSGVSVPVFREFTLSEAERVWLISDTHFDHTNIIRYCNRPFGSVEEMNETIRRNWNDTIAPDDLVYFLGDLAYGRGSRPPRWWATQLNGEIVWVKGSHDRGVHVLSVIPNVVKVVSSETISCGGVEFMLVHDVFGTADGFCLRWDGWTVHGHNHANQPHLNMVRRRVNVSVEVVDYRPISLARIVQEVSR